MSPALERTQKLLRECRALLREMFIEDGLDPDQFRPPPFMTIGDLLSTLRREIAELKAEPLVDD